MFEIHTLFTRIVAINIGGCRHFCDLAWFTRGTGATGRFKNGGWDKCFRFVFSASGLNQKIHILYTIPNRNNLNFGIFIAKIFFFSIFSPYGRKTVTDGIKTILSPPTAGRFHFGNHHWTAYVITSAVVCFLSIDARLFTADMGFPKKCHYPRKEKSVIALLKCECGDL